MANEDLRKLMKDERIHQWEVAEKIGVSEVTLCRKMRRDLSLEDRLKFQSAILKIQAERKGS